ncbi:unnamed protein product [Caretta caretta]
MEPGNETLVTDFILEGLANTRELPSLFFLLLYLLTLLGNALTLLTVLCDPQLHALPTYGFLGHLSFLDTCLSSVTVPKILPGLAGPSSRTISFGGCVVQLYAFHFLASTVCFLYTVMAYDRFLAVCHPLRYTVVMSRRACVGLAAGTWLTGSLHAAIQAALTFCLPYCGPNRVEYFICDIPAMLKLACTDMATNRAVILANIGAVAAVCFLLICGRLRVFSTCSAHLSLVLWLFESHIQRGSSCILHCSHPSAEPLHIHSEEQGDEKGLKKLACGQTLSPYA